MNNWFLVKTTNDGREMWQCGNDYPRGYVWQYSSPPSFSWAVYGEDGNDEVSSGRESELQLAMSAAGKVLGEYSGQ